MNIEVDSSGAAIRDNPSELLNASSERAPASARVPVAQLTRDMPLYVVMNVTSGARDPEESRQTVADVLTRHGQRHELLLIESASQIESTAKQAAELAHRNNGAVAVAAGDGTINAVAHAVLPTRRPFGIIPKGTFNFMGRAHGIPTELEPATENLVTGRVTPVQVGALNDRIFLVNASVGLHPQLLQDRERATQKYGRHQSVAFWAGMKTIFDDHREFVLRIAHDREEKVVRTASLFVSNNVLQMERVDEELAEAVESWRLAAVVMKPVSGMKLFWLALRGAIGKLGDDERIVSFDFKQMTVDPWLGPERQVRVATDGELMWMRPPLKFSIAKDPLLLIKPVAAA